MHRRAVVGILDVQMAGEHIGQPANLAPTHGIGLTCDRKWPHPNLADPSGGKVAVGDRVHLVHARGGLVHALAEDGDDLLGADPQVVKGIDLCAGQTGFRRIAGPGGDKGLIQARNMRAGIGVINDTPTFNLGQQPAE